MNRIFKTNDIWKITKVLEKLDAKISDREKTKISTAKDPEFSLRHKLSQQLLTSPYILFILSQTTQSSVLSNSNKY